MSILRHWSPLRAARYVRAAADAGVELVCDIAGDLGRMRADPGRLRQVLLNLVGNAVKFTARGGMVHVTSRQDASGGLEIRICDTGIGISERERPLVLEPFGRSADPRALSQPGAGLGLPLAKHLIELHDGTLTLESEPEQGTAATISFPAARKLRE